MTEEHVHDEECEHEAEVDENAAQAADPHPVGEGGMDNHPGSAGDPTTPESVEPTRW